MDIDPSRLSGILLHPTSLPDAGVPPAAAASVPSLQAPGSGDFGASAYHFVDWLVAAGQQLWQVLPLGPVGPGHSPYMSPSAFALNPLLIDLQDLVSQGWLPPDATEAEADAHGHGYAGGTARTRQAPAAAARIDYAAVSRFRMSCLRAAARSFFDGDSSRQAYDRFCASESGWLDDYALFMAIGERHPQVAWPEWPVALARRDRDALAEARAQLGAEIDFWRFVQWTAFRQWARLKRYANERRVRIIGDLPIFVALHSADVWAHPELFDLDGDLRPRTIAGVPPDYFSATGQLWGNPLYRWDRHAADGYSWWIRRVKAALTTADVVRIDHFRAFAAHWEVAADAPDASGGRWAQGPGEALFQAVKAALNAGRPAGANVDGDPAVKADTDAKVDSAADAQAGDPLPGALPIIAEDLGFVTPDVIALRKSIGLPGMRVLQFAFGDDARNPYLPHNFTRNTVAYSGTHDNDTSLGWFAAAPQAERARAQVYLKTDGREINWDLIHAASQSVARMAIYPLQDVLGLGSEARMNRPGDAEGCWGWRFDWSQVRPWHASRLRQISAAHGRNGLTTG
jgi:4-alpha-glucanotransferase